MQEVKFGLADHRVMWVDSKKVLEVEFLNGRVYRSFWEPPDHNFRRHHTKTYLYTIRYGDKAPLAEQDVEMMVAEFLCHQHFDPNFKDDHEEKEGTT